jgi:hypothetical protein
MRIRDRMTLDRPLPYVALCRGGDHYIFRYEKGREAQLFSTLVELAENEDLNFTWLDILLILHEVKR